MRKDSPAINAGNNIDIPNGIITDLDGNSRVVGASVDMGAYEYERVLPVPRNLIGTVGDRQVTLSWDVVNFADSYEVYKYEGATGPVTSDDWELVASDINVTTYEVTELTNGTSYAFAVKAVSTLGDSDFTDAAVATPSTVADAPTDVSATVGNGQAVVSFTAPTNNGGSAITGYTVTVLVDGSSTGITATGTASPITVTGLTNGTAYTFTVRATNAAGDSAESDASDEVTPRTVSGAPTGVSATAGNGQAVVSFTVPTNNGGSAITGYTVTALANGSATGIIATGTASPITVTGLTNGTAYTFTVRATNAAGDSSESDPSGEVTPRTVPDAPSDVSATAGNGQAVVSFTVPTNNGGSAITGYTVTALVNGSTTGITATGTASPITVAGLTNGTAYTFTVRATNAAGNSAESDASSEVTPRTVPGAPSDVSATAGNGQAVVSFTAPMSNGGSAITGYTVTALVNGSATGITATGTASPITVNGLTNGTAYTFTVRATNAAGNSAESNASGEVTPRTVPDAPLGVSATAGNGQAVVSFTVPTNNGGSTITGYTVTALVNGSATGITATDTASPITVSGLTNGTAYTFTVRATNAAGDSAASDASDEVTPRTVPDAPTGVSATGGNEQVEVSFTVPTNNGGSAITGYTVTALVDGSATGITATGTASPITVTGLTNGTSYTFTVRATNALGDSSESDLSGDVTPRTVPDAPSDVNATAGNGQAVVSFTAPTNNGGSAITGYTVKVLVNGSATGITATGTASPITVSGLTNGTSYTFTVRATNAAGDSAASDASDEVTPRTVPGAPTGVSATGGNEQVEVSFTVPTNNGGSAITGYTVTALVNGSATGITATGTASPITVSGLTNGTAYTFTVRATNALGDSSESDPSGEVTPRTVPDAPSGVNATAGNEQAVVSFTVPTNNGGSAITGYTVTALVNGSATGITATGTASPITVSGLTNGTSYTFTVRATNAAGDSAESSPTEPATPQPSASVPDAPTESGNNSLVVLVISTSGSITIPVGGSGEVNLGEEISIVIPDGASDREQRITIEKVLNTENLISEGETLASDIYELLKNFQETFDKPVTLTFVFDPSIAGSNQTFAIFYYDETEKKWIKVGGEVNGNTIRAEVDHFTKFAVFAIDEEASATDRNAIAFSDISEHWAVESIKQAVLDGIITGYPDGTFRPDEPVSRAEFTVMLAHALDLDGSRASLLFTDRTEIGAWAEEAVARAVLLGIVNGYGDGRFQPNAPITRSEMATMIARALQLPTEAIAQTDFTDDDRIPSWAKSAVESLRKLDIVNGRSDGKYVPDDKLTRAESVVALLRMLRSKGQD